jgi:hypothetical protein
MNDDTDAPRPLERWYWIAAIASVLFMLVGCGGYLVQVMTDPASLPLDQKAMVEAQPKWSLAAYAIAVWIGLIGTVMLLLRRKVAEPLLLVSVLAVVFTFLPYAVTPAMRDLASTNDIAVAIVIILITWTIFWFARHSRQRGWLR